MSWTEPKTWTDGSAVTADDLNEQVSDNLIAASTIQTYTPQVLSLPGPDRETFRQGVLTVGAGSYGRYVQAGDLVYFQAVFIPTGNTWTDPDGIATADVGEAYCAITTPSDIGVLINASGNLSWPHSRCMEAARIGCTPYQDFTGRNAVTIGYDPVSYTHLTLPTKRIE